MKVLTRFACSMMEEFVFWDCCLKTDRPLIVSVSLETYCYLQIELTQYLIKTILPIKAQEIMQFIWKLISTVLEF